MTTVTALSAELGSYAEPVAKTLSRAHAEQILARINRGDYTVWKPQPTEITNRLGWLTIAERMREEIPAIRKVVEGVRKDGYTHALLLGMGGSSLAPEVFSRVFGTREGYLALHVLDSTDPDAVTNALNALDISKTLFVVSTKSGGTVETFSFFRTCYRRVVAALGADHAGEHFMAITDPGSALADTASKYRFRSTFLNDPNIGGRYSALSHFGLVPAALVGIDLNKLLDRALKAEGDQESALELGVIVGELAAAGRDKITFICSPGIDAWGAWVEQLIAESTGKEDKGILPVADEPVGPPSVYGNDRLFVSLRLARETSNDSALSALRSAGHPVVQIDLADAYDLGGEFFRWELATAIAGWRIGINPFDQPNVEAAKQLARLMVDTYQKSGALPTLTPTASADGVSVYATTSDSADVRGVVAAFLNEIKAGDYIALQAWMAPSPESTQALERIRVALRDKFKVATTLGYGPRFLHSTGQLHKGDGNHGVFVQVVTPAPPVDRDVAIPDTADADTSSITFGVLKEAQSLGDRRALLDRGRRVLRIDVPRDAIAKGLQQLASLLS
jgi:transaldolase / glucose-6-phosphate isomerase